MLREQIVRPVSDCHQLGLMGCCLSGATLPRSLLQAKQIVRATCAPRIANRSCRCGVFSSQDKQYACGTTMSAVRFGFLIMRAPANTILFRTPVGKRQRAGSAIFGTKLYRISLRGRAAIDPAGQACSLPGVMKQRLGRAGYGGKRPPGITPSGAGQHQGHGCRIPS